MSRFSSKVFSLDWASSTASPVARKLTRNRLKFKSPFLNQAKIDRNVCRISNKSRWIKGKLITYLRRGKEKSKTWNRSCKTFSSSQSKNRFKKTTSKWIWSARSNSLRASNLSNQNASTKKPNSKKKLIMQRKSLKRLRSSLIMTPKTVKSRINILLSRLRCRVKMPKSKERRTRLRRKFKFGSLKKWNRRKNLKSSKDTSTAFKTKPIQNNNSKIWRPNWKKWRLRSLRKKRRRRDFRIQK